MRRKKRQHPGKNKRVGGFLAVSMGLVLVGLLVTGMSQLWSQGSHQQTAAAAPVTGDAADPETRYLGRPTDPDGLAVAEAGQVGQPTLVWFHADWCHVCQQVKPEVVNLGQEFEGKVKFVRLNVDDGESQAAVRRYGVRATPTFILLDSAGQVRGNVPGWSGYQAFVEAFDQLLTSTN
jgi:thiol-disulfide isomerase/thioredoxin